MPEFSEVDVSSVAMDKVIFATEVAVARGEMLIGPHKCENPAHNNPFGTVDFAVMLLIHTVDHELIPVMFRPDAPVVDYLGDPEQFAEDVQEVRKHC